MNRWMRFGLDFIFLASFGFGGGCLVLLYFVVPTEQWMMDNGYSQERIDSLMSVVVVAWILAGCLTAFLFDRYVTRRGYRRTALLMTGATFVGACIVLYMFVNTESAMIAMNQGEVETVNDRFTFGPYPTREDMEALKDAGYDGIVTLLNPLLVFEGTLLQEELDNGRDIGLEVHSFPMLPWVGDNKNALDEIRQLFSEDETKRFYIHCYLGRHRVDIVKQIAMEVSGTVIELKPMLQASRLERGPVFFHEQGRVAVGPLPTNEEWFTFVFRLQTREIITIADNESMLEQVARIADENNVRFTPMPMDKDVPDERALAALLEHVRATDHKLYIHGFDGREHRVKYVQTLLEHGAAGLDLERLERIDGLNVAGEYGSWTVVGSMPDRREQLQALRAAGVERLVALGWDEGSAGWSEWEIAAGAAGLELVAGAGGASPPDRDGDIIGEAFRLARELLASPVPVYAFAPEPDDPLARQLLQAMNGLHYGIDKNVDPDTLTLSQGTAVLLRRQRNVLLGPVLAEHEWRTFLQANGIGKVIMLYAPSLQTREEVAAVRSLAERHDIEWMDIPLFETFTGEIVDALYEDNETVYLMTLPELQPLVLEGLTYRE